MQLEMADTIRKESVLKVIYFSSLGLFYKQAISDHTHNRGGLATVQYL